MKCPVCDRENTSLLCPACGFDSSRDYGRYPAFGPVRKVPSVSVMRQHWTEKQKKPELRRPLLIAASLLLTLGLCIWIGMGIWGEKPVSTEPGGSVVKQEPPETTKASAFESEKGLEISDVYVLLYVNEMTILHASLNGTDIDSSKIEWSTSDANVATVMKGVVVAVGKGEAEITAEYKGRKATCLVICRSLQVSHTDVTLHVGDSFVLKIADDSGMPQIADWKVSSSGVVICKKEGFTTTVSGWNPGVVTMETKVKGVTYRCIVRVIE